MTQHDDMAHTRAVNHRLVDDRLGAHCLAATQGSVDGDHGCGLPVVQALRDGIRAVYCILLYSNWGPRLRVRHIEPAVTWLTKKRA